MRAPNGKAVALAGVTASENLLTPNYSENAHAAQEIGASTVDACMRQNIFINDEFKVLIPPLQPNECARLEKDILARQPVHRSMQWCH